MKKSTIIAALAVVLAGVSINSYADTNTANLTVTASIAEACAVSTTAVAFLQYDPVNANKTADLEVAGGAVKTICSLGTTGTVLLDNGDNGTGVGTPERFMKTGTGGANELLGYQLYSGGAHTTVWGGDKASGKALATGTGLETILTVYGTIPAGQNLVKVGSYTDTVVVTIDFTE